MAEILGIVAGAAQLLDLSARLVLASSQLYAHLKNVPEEIEALKKNTQDFYDLLWMISSDLDGPLNSHPNSLHVTHRIVSIFNDAMKESEELAILLERLSNKGSSSVKRFWSSVAGLKERTEIADRGRRIESLKASIQMWYQHQSMMRLRAVEDQLSTITQSQLAAQSSLSLLTQQSARAVDINQSLAMKFQSYHHAGMKMAEIAPQQQRRRSGRNKLCTCRPSVTISHMSKWNLQLFLESKTTHATDCSRHTDSTTWSFGLRALSPRVQAMFGLRVGGWSLSVVGRISPHFVVDPSQSPAFVAISEARKDLVEILISNGVYYHERLGGIDIKTITSNGLTLSVYTESPLDIFHQTHMESICATLRSRLLEAFSSGTASPADRSLEGITILHKFLEFATDFNPYQEALFDLLSSTIELLIPNDTDLNPYLHLLLLIPVGSGTENIRLQQLRLDAMLISHGLDEISDEFRRNLACYSLVGFFNKNPCLLENYGQNPVHLAIMQRSQLKLRDLLGQGKVDLKVDNPPLLTLAIRWPAGLELLLKAGAEPSVAIKEAILQQQHESISLLLDYGCPVFVSAFGRVEDLVDIAISYHVSPSVVLLLVERQASRRQELLELALGHLPEAVIETSWCDYHVRPRPLLDYHAIEIYEQLQAHYVEVSRALWPGPYTTIYHSRYVLHNSSLAMKLYDLGFHDIDKADDHGITPLVNAIMSCGSNTDDCPRLIQWYLDMGVTLGFFSTHVLSQSICFPTMVSARVWISQEQELYGVLKVFRQLIDGDRQPNDDCRCWCSTMGCTPIGLVLRKKAWALFSFSCDLQLRGRRRWLYLLPRYSSLGLNLNQNCFTEICRLEIFDRLGMAHTCCHRLEVCPQNHFPITRNELEELQQEDQSLKEALDLYLELYLDLLRQHQGGFESFWISWWSAVDRFLPFDCPRNSNEGFPPLSLPGFPEYELCCKIQDGNGYSPDITALTSTVHLCVTLLDRIGIDSFLDQLQAYSFYG